MLYFLIPLMIINNISVESDFLTLQYTDRAILPLLTLQRTYSLWDFVHALMKKVQAFTNSKPALLLQLLPFTLHKMIEEKLSNDYTTDSAWLRISRIILCYVCLQLHILYKSAVRNISNLSTT